MRTYLNGYWKARALKLLVFRRDEELLGVNGDPTFGGVALPRNGTPREPSPQLPDHFECVDMRAFMERVRALASQI